MSRKGDAEMYYCHTRSGSTIELFLPILAIAALLAGCVTRPVDFGPGLVKFDARQYGEAILAFQEIADKDGGEANRARFYMGECYKYKSRYDRAIEQFQMVVDAEPSGSYLANQARDRISQIREGRKDIERLGVLFYSGELGDDKAADALMERGLVYETKLCDYENAIKSYRQVVDEFPGTEKAAQAQISIGNIYFYRLYDYEGGWPEFQKVNAENYPELPQHVKEAEGLLRETNRLLQEIAKQYDFIKDAREREKLAWKGYAGIQLPPEVRNMQGQIAESRRAIVRRWRQLRNYPKALEAYRILIERNPFALPQAAEARYGIAEIYRELGRYPEAVDAYNEYINLHPTIFRWHEAVYNVAMCYENIRDYGKAYEMYKIYSDAYALEYPELKLPQTVKLKLREYGKDEDQDGFPRYMELMEGTSDTDPNEHPE